MRKTVFLIFLLSFVALSPSVSGQIPKPIDVTERNIKDNLPDIKTRSLELERIRREANKVIVPREAKFPEIKEDFEKIQQLNAERIQKKYDDKSAANEAVADAAKQIRKSSLRLKANLFPADSGKKRKVKADKSAAEPDANSLLIKLDNAIYHFVANPIFKNILLVNPIDSLKAEKDLNEIIRLSELIIKTFS